MFDVGSFRASTCAGMGRRSFLKMGASIPAALGGLSLMQATQVAEAAQAARAKSVIFVWLWGAPSHIDTFDPKPNSPSEYRGPFAPIPTRQPGVFYSELLPKLASRSDRFSLIRSQVSTEPGHPDAGTFGLTGFKERPEPVQPNFGSIVGKHRGNQGSLPPFVMLGRGIPRDVVRIVDGYGGGKFGKAADPFMVSCSDVGRVEIPSLQLLDGLTPNRISGRDDVRARLDVTLRQLDRAGLDGWDRSYQRAYGLITSPQARAAFELSQPKSQFGVMHSTNSDQFTWM